MKSVMTDDDKKELEYMLSLEYKMPYQLFKTKHDRRKAIYIMTPVLFILSILNYWVGTIYHHFSNYFMFYISMPVCIIITLWIVYFQVKGKKFEQNVHDFIWNQEQSQVIEISDQELKSGIQRLCEVRDVERAFLYDGFFFFITTAYEKKLIVIKPAETETSKLLAFIKEKKILFEEKKEPFNIYEYFPKESMRASML